MTFWHGLAAGISVVAILAFLIVRVCRWKRRLRCPDCNAPSGTIHKPRCQYLVKQAGG